MLTDGIDNYKQELIEKIDSLKIIELNKAYYHTDVHTLAHLQTLKQEANLSKGKQRKRKENQIKQIMQSSKFIEDDYKKYCEQLNKKQKLNELKKQLENTNNYISKVLLQIKILKKIILFNTDKLM